MNNNVQTVANAFVTYGNNAKKHGERGFIVIDDNSIIEHSVDLPHGYVICDNFLLSKVLTV